MDWQTWFTFGSLALLVIALISSRVGPDVAMVGTLTLLIIAGIVEPGAAVAGFANPAVVTIAALFVIATGLQETGAVEVIARRTLGRPKTRAGAQVRMMAPVATLSAFMNNTPIVAMFMPIMSDWAKRLRVSPSALFMPLSFAAILGGACTLIGTSSNVAINELYLEYLDQNPAVGIAAPSPLKQFWLITPIGLPAAVIGIGFIALTARWLLPERRPASGHDEVDARRYATEMLVEPGSPIIGQSIEAAGLRHLPGLYLSHIERDTRSIPAVAPTEIIRAGDILAFVGLAESVVDLRKIRGLVPATDQIRKIDTDSRSRTAVEAVISHTSPLVGKTIRESQFRTVYNAAVVAVHRGGQRIHRKIGDIRLQAGDTLLVETHRGFLEAYRDSPDFYLVSRVGSGVVAPMHERAPVALAIMAVFVILLSVPVEPAVHFISQKLALGIPRFELTPLPVALTCAMMMIATRCCTGTTARSSINWQVLIAIGAALGIGKAMSSTGAARIVAHAMTTTVDSGSGNAAPYLAIALLFIVTNVFCQLITNKGAAVLMFPIAVQLADELALNPLPFVVTLMVSAACSLMSPVGFQTNLMVLGPGGYRSTDYLRLGLPLTLLIGVINTLLCPLVYPFAP